MSMECSGLSYLKARQADRGEKRGDVDSRRRRRRFRWHMAQALMEGGTYAEYMRLTCIPGKTVPADFDVEKAIAENLAAHEAQKGVCPY